MTQFQPVRYVADSRSIPQQQLSVDSGYVMLLRSCYGTAVALLFPRFFAVANCYGRGRQPLPYVASVAVPLYRGPHFATAVYTAVARRGCR